MSQTMARNRANEQYTQWLNHYNTGQNSIANYENLIGYKTSDVLYILGSGKSINSIAARKWNQVRLADSIAFNLFIAHPFTPTLYHMEFTPKILARFDKWVKLKGNDYNGVPLIFNAKHLQDPEKLSERFSNNRIYYSIPRLLYTQSNKRVMKKALKKEYLESDYKLNNYYVHHRGSLTLVLSLGVLMGYKKIVLMGVDLNNSEYFFEDRKLYQGPIADSCREIVHQNRLKGITPTKSGIHKTENPSLFPESFTVSQFLSIFKESVLDELGIIVEIENESSALSPLFNTHKWN